MLASRCAGRLASRAVLRYSGPRRFVSDKPPTPQDGAPSGDATSARPEDAASAQDAQPPERRLTAREEQMAMDVRGERPLKRTPDPYQAARTSYRTQLLFVAIAGLVSATVVGTYFQDQSEPAGVPGAELQFEKKRRKTTSKEDNRNLISSQHLQVKKSWENPGLYAWGSNAGKVVAPDSDEAMVKSPRRLTWFDGKILRDVKLDKNFGAAIDESGNLLQWGIGYSKDAVEPVMTLQGRNLIQIGISRDRIFGLGSNGTVYSVPVSKADQETGPKPSASSWNPFGTDGNISYRIIRPNNLGLGEKVTSIAVGLEHALLATNGWRIYSVAAATQDFPSKDQMGIPGLTWDSRPNGAFDQPHEVVQCRDYQVTAVACGDYHSVILDRTGRIASFGDNSSGQLGIGSDQSSTPLPHDIPLSTLYRGTGQVAKGKGIAAGGSNSYFIVEAVRLAAQKDDPNSARSIGRVNSDVWTCGSGILGALGTGRWTHVQNLPTKIPALSELFEWDEKAHKVIPIGIAALSAGSNHVAAVLNNVTYLKADERGSANDTNWGADIMFFGGNESYQLGTGKRNNLATPTYIQPLDQVAERELRGKEKHRFHITPRATIKHKGRQISVEQRVECGRGITAVYSGT